MQSICARRGSPIVRNANNAVSLIVNDSSVIYRWGEKLLYSMCMYILPRHAPSQCKLLILNYDFQIAAKTRGQWPCRTCGELKVNKQLTISKFLNFLSKHLCFEQFQRLKPPSGLFEKSKQTAESKQTADIIQNSEILFQTSFL